jgi:protein AroM
MLDRIIFVTLGQTPRTDLVPEIVRALPRPVEVKELGALDGMDSDAIGPLGPGSDDQALVTRLRNGTQVVLGKRWVTGRLQRLLDGIDDSATDAPAAASSQATVLLCSGDFPGLRAHGLFLDAQHLVDHGVDALSRCASTVGLLVPLRRQEGEHHYTPSGGRRLRTAHASPYGRDDFVAAGRSLSDCDLVVMHCMGYTEAQRAAVANGSGRPVLLSRRLVAAALAQLL